MLHYITTYPSPVGILTLACTDKDLVGLWVDGQKYFKSTIPNEVVTNDDMPVFRIAREWLDRYFAGEKPLITALPLAPTGSEFRQRVWKLLCGIPYGEVDTYGGIAKRIALEMNKSTMSSQAIGGAVGHNPISIIIPCHRVVGANGSLTGYGGGIQVKYDLLQLEGADLSHLFIPQTGTAI